MSARLETVRTDAWWGLLVAGRVDDVRAIFLHAIEATGWAFNHHEDAFVFVQGSKEWSGVFCTLREEPLEDVADAVRVTSREVIALNFGGDPDWVDEPYIARWHERWKREYDRRPWVFADWLGVSVPRSELPSRPFRRATLAEGVTLRQAEGLVHDERKLLAVPRGVVVLGMPTEGIRRVASRIYNVTHYLDDDSFACSIESAGRIQELELRGASITVPGIERVRDVDGETDPRPIVRTLGIPEDYMFPPKRE